MPNYTLRYVKGQEFYGFDSAADALRAAAEFDDTVGGKVIEAKLTYDMEMGNHGVSVFWEDA